MLLGYLLALLSAILFTFADFLVKIMNQIPPYQVAFFRSVQFMVFSFIGMKFMKVKYISESRNKNFLFVLVGVLGALGLLFTYYGLTYLPMSDTIIIQQTGPIMIAVLA